MVQKTAVCVICTFSPIPVNFQGGQGTGHPFNTLPNRMNNLRNNYPLLSENGRVVLGIIFTWYWGLFFVTVV